VSFERTACKQNSDLWAKIELLVVVTDISRHIFNSPAWFTCSTPVIVSHCDQIGSSQDWFRSYVLFEFSEQRFPRSLDPVQCLESCYSVWWLLSLGLCHFLFCSNIVEISELHKTINQLTVLRDHAAVYVVVFISISFTRSVYITSFIDLCAIDLSIHVWSPPWMYPWLPFCLCLVRAPLTVLGRSGTSLIEAELREGWDGGDRGVWTWHPQLVCDIIPAGTGCRGVGRR